MSYIIKSGDTLGRIAQRQGVSIQDIQKMNPEITDINKVFVGQQLVLPEAGDEVVSLESEFDQPPVKPKSQAKAVETLDDVVAPVEQFDVPQRATDKEKPSNPLFELGSEISSFFIPKAHADADVVPDDVKIKPKESPSVEAIADIATAANPADMAYKYLGLSEKDEEGAQAVRGFFDNIGLQGFRADKTPEEFATSTAWCAAFLANVLADSGYDVKDMLNSDDPYKQVRALSYMNAGREVDQDAVKAGDIMVKHHDEDTRKKYNTGPAHVGVVVKVEDGRVYYIGGNTGDKVELSDYALADHKFNFRRVGGKEDIPTESLPSLMMLKAGKTGRKIADKVSGFFGSILN